MSEPQAKTEVLTPVGYIIVDIETREIDWDGALHTTKDAAIESLTNPRQMFCRTPEEETDEVTYYGLVYEVLPVVAEKES